MQPLLDGTVIILGGVAYTMPPCGLDTLEKYADEVDKNFYATADSQPLSMKQVTLIVNLVWGALQLNYPDIERATVARGLNLGNAMPAMQAVMALSLPAAAAALRAVDGEGVKGLGE